MFKLIKKGYWTLYRNTRLNIVIRLEKDSAKKNSVKEFRSMFSIRCIDSKICIIPNLMNPIVHDRFKEYFLVSSSTTITKENADGISRLYSFIKISENSEILITSYDYGIAAGVSSNSFIATHLNTIVHLGESVTAFLFENSVAYISKRSNAIAYDDTKVYLYGEGTVTAEGRSTIKASGNSSVFANANSKVSASESAFVYSNTDAVVTLNGDAGVNASGFSKVFANDTSLVYAYDHSTVVATGFSLIKKLSHAATIIKKNHFGSVIEQIFTVEEDMIVYKKLEDERIATLRLEKGQIFQSENHGKCRTDRAFVIDISSLDGKTKFTSGRSYHFSSFIYEVGKEVKTEYDPSISECSAGIHFFLTEEKAKDYELT